MLLNKHYPKARIKCQNVNKFDILLTTVIEFPDEK